jgi:transposase
MWTNENRGRYDRSQLRYPSDLTAEEWGLIEPLIPPAKPGGNKRTVVTREVEPRWVCRRLFCLSHAAVAHS